MYAEIIVDIAHGNVDRLFTYAIPEGMAVTAGQRVLAPFGRGNKRVEGFVLSLLEEPREQIGQIKPILRTMEPWPALLLEQLALAKWLQESYHCLMIDALRLMLPAAMRQGRVKEKTQRTVQIAENAEELRQALLNKSGTPRSPKQLEVFDFLRESGLEMAVDDIAGFIPGARPAIAALLKKGFLIESGHVTFRRPGIMKGPAMPETQVVLNPRQQAAVEAVTGAMAKGSGGTYLLHGITGSGKTEVYMHCIKAVLDAGKTAIVLVPEIALTPQTVERFKSRFGGGIAVLHSRLSDGERFDEWRRIRLGKAQVVIGARGAVFAPTENLGLIVIDEEHEQSYQSESAPRYHAIEVARKRCRLQNAPLLLGSATPSITTYRRTLAGRYHLLELPERVQNRPLPKVSIVDMRVEFEKGNNSIFSAALYQKLKDCLQKGHQAILFINRRGYSTFVACRGCGGVLQCSNCDVSLTYHRLGERLKCHYCGYGAQVPAVCPSCGKPYLKYFGVGTQQVEEQVHEHFPEATTLRMDMDTTRAKDAHQKLLARFAAGEAQIMIGTQMIAKGLDYPNVTLVGVVAADATLHLPDYRSAERTFQLLTQVAGRAGRDEAPGEVVIQTYSPEHPSVQFSKTHDYKGFYAYEINMRRAALFPPYALFVRALFSSVDKAALFETGALYEQGLEQAVQEALGPEHQEEFLLIVGGPAPIARKRGVYRYQVVVKLLRTPRTAAALKAVYGYAQAHRGELFATLEVNPGEML